MSTHWPPALTHADCFRQWDASALKLYLWLRARASRSEASASAERGFLAVDTTNAEIEHSIDVSKNTITKLIRFLQTYQVCLVTSDRQGYHFRLGEWVSVPTTELDLTLTVDIYYLDALVSQEQPTPLVGSGASRVSAPRG